MNVNQIMRVYEEYGDIVEVMLGYNIDEEDNVTIDYDVSLGVGYYGEVYSGIINGRQSAVKGIGMDHISLEIGKLTIDDLFSRMQKEYGLEDLDVFRMVNRDLVGEGRVGINIPSGVKDCRTPKYLYIPRNYSTSKTWVNFPKSSYLTTSMYSEFIISSLCSRLVEEGTSANFIKIYGYYTNNVSDPLNHNQFMFMDQIDGSLCNYCDDYSYSITLADYIQIIHAIECYQTKYDIVHGDLHTGNVFWRTIKDDDEFNGYKLKDAEYFHYHIKGIDLYIPNTGLLLYIGDFGLAVKYRAPVIGPVRVCYGGTCHTPNFKTREYDLLTITEAIFTDTSCTPNREPLELFRKIMQEAKDSSIEFDEKYGRPKVSDSSIMFSPSEVISRYPEFDEYKVRPKGKRIVTLGTI